MYPYSSFHPAMALYNPHLGSMGFNPMLMGMSPMTMGMHPLMNPMMFGGNPMTGMYPFMNPMLGTNPFMFRGGMGGYGGYGGLGGYAPPMQLSYSRAAHSDALGQSHSTGGFAPGDAAMALRFGVEGLEWYGRRTMRNYPHLYQALHGVGSARATQYLRGVGNGRPAAWTTRTLGPRWSGRVTEFWARGAANKMVGQAGLRGVGNPQARAAMSQMDDVARTMSAARGARPGTAVAVRGGQQALTRGGGRVVASTVGKGLGRLVPAVNVGIAALDTAQFVSDMRDPEASTARKVTSGITAGLSTVAATNIPVVSQVAGFAALGTSLLRSLF